MDIGDRIKERRLKLGLTQTDLAQKVGLTYVQIGRYETKKATPSAEVLQKLALALETTIDYLINGLPDEAAAVQLTDNELLNQFRAVQSMNEQDKFLIKTLIDALITKRQIQKLA